MDRPTIMLIDEELQENNQSHLTVGCTLLHIHENNKCFLGEPWCAANRPHGHPCQGLFMKTDQFRLDPTQSSAHGRRCDWVSSVYHLALVKCSGISQHATILHCTACIPSSTSIPAPTQPTIAMTHYTPAPTVNNSSAFHAQL